MTHIQRNLCIGGALATLGAVGSLMNSGALPARAAAAAPVTTVAVSNFPNPQNVAGTVAVSNFPSTQAVTVGNFPSSQTVSVSNLPTTQSVSGTVSVGNFPSTQTVGFSAPPTVNVGNTTANPVPASPAMPSNPFFQELVNTGSSLQAFGPGTGTFAVTSLTLTNFDNVVHAIRIFQPALSGGSPGFCQGTSVIGGGQGVRVLVPSNQTVHLALPAPIVFGASNNQTCGGVSFENTNGTNYISVVGYSY